MWTVFWGFLTPPPPLWTNMDILGTPLPVHVDFSMTPPSPRFISKKISNYQFIAILKSKHTTSYLWNIKLIHYLQIPDIKCKNVGIINHMDRGLDNLPMWTNMDVLGTPLTVHMVLDEPLCS